MFNYTPEALNQKGVYIIQCINTGDVYIGSTYQTFKHRWQAHIRELRRGVHNNTRLQRAWNKHTHHAFAFIIIEAIYGSNQSVLTAEQFYIDVFWGDDCYNQNPNAENTTGRPTPPEVRLKLSIAGKGKKRSPETRQRMSEAARLKPPASERTRQIRRELRLGKKDNPELAQKKAAILRANRPSLATIQRIAEKQRGNERSAKPYPSFIAPDGTIHLSGKNLHKFCREHGLNSSSMLKIINGIHQHHRGWRVYREGIDPVFKQEPIGKLIPPLISASGVIVIGERNITDFCRRYSLSQGHLSDVINGRRLSHKGWRLYKP